MHILPNTSESSIVKIMKALEGTEIQVDDMDRSTYVIGEGENNHLWNRVHPYQTKLLLVENDEKIKELGVFVRVNKNSLLMIDNPGTTLPQWIKTIAIAR